MTIGARQRCNDRLDRLSRAFVRHWPLFVALATLWNLLGLVLVQARSQSGGHLVYALDDAYIHMAMAKNLAQHGVWGVTRYAFTSSSSSPLWTLMLSISYLVFGARELTPLVLNAVLATGVIVCIYLIVRREATSQLATATVLLAGVFLIPLPALVFTGMEHVLQVLATLVFAHLSASLLADGMEHTKRNLAALLIVVSLLPLIRYESLFLILTVAVLFSLRRRWGMSCLLLIAAGLPVACYGAVSVAQGWFWLPVSLLLKGRLPGSELPVDNLVFLATALLFIWVLHPAGKRQAWQRGDVWAVLFIVTTVLHTLLARLGSLGRYEAYLVALGLLAGSTLVAERGGYLMLDGSDVSLATRLIGLIALIPLLYFFLMPRFSSSATVSLAMRNIYEQQYQMGLFLNEFYPEVTVAANDIGAVNYLADIRCIDVWGLGDREVAEQRMTGTYDTHQVRDIVIRRGVKIALVYGLWFQSGYLATSGVPKEWVKVAEWRIQDNVVAGSDTVSFYAVGPGEEANLAASVAGFAPQLPDTVLVTMWPDHGRKASG